VEGEFCWQHRPHEPVPEVQHPPRVLNHLPPLQQLPLAAIFGDRLDLDGIPVPVIPGLIQVFQPKIWTRERYLALTVAQRSAIPNPDIEATLKSLQLCTLFPARSREILNTYFTRDRPQIEDPYGLFSNCRYGESYQIPGTTIVVAIGTGKADIEFRASDPVIEFNYAGVTESVVARPKIRLDLEKHVDPIYRYDIVEQEELSKFPLEKIYCDSNRIAFNMETILQVWESGFSFYDEDCSRILPRYPSGNAGEPLAPQIIRNVYATARHRKMSMKKYPLLYILLRTSSLLEQLYDFINNYQQLIVQYDKVAGENLMDWSIYNRRDYTASIWLRKIYSYYDLQNYGYRKFTTIESSRGRNGSQIFYYPVLLALFIKNGFAITFDEQPNGSASNFAWIPVDHNPPKKIAGVINPIRPFVISPFIINP
jgi:hypothetical protein